MAEDKRLGEKTLIKGGDCQMGKENLNPNEKVAIAINNVLEAKSTGTSRQRVAVKHLIEFVAGDEEALTALIRYNETQGDSKL